MNTTIRSRPASQNGTGNIVLASFFTEDDATFEVMANVTLSPLFGPGVGVPAYSFSIVVAYTDCDTGAPASKTLTFLPLAGWPPSTNLTNSDNQQYYHGITQSIRAKKGTPVNVQTAGTVGGITYIPDVTVCQISS